MAKTERFWVSVMIWLGWALIGILPVLLADQGIRLTVSPSQCFNPCAITVTVWAAPEIKPNEQVCLAIDNGEFYRKSCWPHLGLKWLDVRVRGIPTGTYEVSVFTLDFEDHQLLMVH